MKQFQNGMESFNEFINTKQKMFLNDYGFDNGKIERMRMIAHANSNNHNNNNYNNLGVKFTAKRKNSLIEKNVCDIDWPVCLMDNAFRYDPTYFFIFKIIDRPVIIDNYFFSGCGNDFEPMNRNYFKNKANERLVTQIRAFETILIERRPHFCDVTVTKTTRKNILTKASAEATEEVKIDKEIKRSRQTTIYMNKACLLKNSTNYFDDYYKDHNETCEINNMNSILLKFDI